MLKVTIEQSQATQDAINTRQGVSSSGRPWQFRTQEVWIFKPESSFPQKFVITLPDNIPFYAAGDYQLDVESLLVPDAYSSLSLGRGGIILKNAQKSTDDATKKADYTKMGG